MAQVPYQPFATAQPTGGGERVGVSTPPAAFGENIAQALGQLGTTVGQVGGELFQRALALQDLKNENDARQAQTEFVVKASQLHADYGALTGKAAADALPKFLNDQQQLREQIRGGLGSAMAQRYYDSDSLPFMQRNVFSAASHAAEENKKFTIDTYKNKTAIDAEAAAQHPDDENYVNQKRDSIRQDAQDAAFLIYGTQDPNDPNVVKAVNDALSHQRAEQILGKSKSDPIVANEWFKKYGDDLTNPVDRDRVLSTVEFRGASVASANVANDILSAHRQPDGTFDASVKQMQDEARARVAEIMPDNKLAPEMAAGKIDGQTYAARVADRLDKADATKKVNEAIVNMGIHDAQQLMAAPGMDKTIPMLDPKIRGNLQAYINNLWKGSDRISSEESMKIINGMRTSDAAEFMAVNPGDPKWHLSTEDQIKIQNQQYTMAQKPQDDPRVSRAMSWLLGARGAELQALQVDKKYPGQEDDYYHFRGALQEALEIWQQDHNGKQPTAAEIVDTIGPQIIKTQYAKPGMTFGTNQEPAFREFARPAFEDIPEDWKQQVIKDVTDKGGTAPTNAQLVQAYARLQFQKFYKQAKPSE